MRYGFLWGLFAQETDAINLGPVLPVRIGRCFDWQEGESPHPSVPYCLEYRCQVNLLAVHSWKDCFFHTFYHCAKQPKKSLAPLSSVVRPSMSLINGGSGVQVNGKVGEQQIQEGRLDNANSIHFQRNRQQLANDLMFIMEYVSPALIEWTLLFWRQKTTLTVSTMLTKLYWFKIPVVCH